MSEHDKEEWQSKIEGLEEALARAKRDVYSSREAREKKLDGIGAQIRYYKNLLKNPDFRQSEKERSKANRDKAKKMTSTVEEKEEYEEPLGVETPAYMNHGPPAAATVLAPRTPNTTLTLAQKAAAVEYVEMRSTALVQ